MLRYLVRRLGIGLVVLVLISVVSFVIIQLPPGDYLTNYVMAMRELAEIGWEDAAATAEAMRVRYGLDRPLPEQYWKWISGIVLRGDLGYSFEALVPVSQLVSGALGNTLILVAASALFIYGVGIPIGVYSAVRQYTVSDYVFTFLGFLGVSVPNFLLALLMLYASWRLFGTLPRGLFSPEFAQAPWSVARVVDMMRNMWIGVIVIGSAGAASVIRVIRSNLLDELRKPYVVTARAKGLQERRLLVKYPLRIAIGPVLSTVGFLLPDLIGASIIASVVLNLQTIGPIYLRALLVQDMYLAGAIAMMLAVLTVIGTIVSDILLAIADPRIRYE